MMNGLDGILFIKDVADAAIDDVLQSLSDVCRRSLLDSPD